MKKNYIAVFIRAEKLFEKITLLLLLTILTNGYSYAQLSADYNRHNITSSSRKGPFDNLNPDGTNRDALPPVITYTALTNTCVTGNRTLTATITDADGVPTSGAGLPMLYWQINSGTYSAVQGVSIGSNQYTFTFGAGAIAGNLVSYYIVAQDNVGNVTAKPLAGTGGYTTNPPASATEPTTPEFYVIQNTLAAGTYTVGAGQTYLTLTDAVNAYNNSCLSGAVIFVLTDATYSTSEVFPITIFNSQASASNTLTIKPNTGVTATISGTANDAIIKLNGSDYVTIDGSNSGGSTRNLTISNASTSLISNVIWVGSASASNGATHNTIKNCTITGNASTTTLAAILSSSGTVEGQTAETANSDNSYINNSLNSSYYGMLIVGPVAGESNTIVSNNTIGSSLATKKLGYRALVLSNQTNMTVNNNSVLGVNSTIGLGSDVDPTAGIVLTGAISGGNVYSNQVEDISNTNVGGWPAYGISLQSTSSNAGVKIYNNFIFNIKGYGNITTPGNNGCGIGVINGGGYGIYYNSVHLYLNQTLAAGGISSSIFIGAGVTGTASLDIRNNIFSNRRTTGTNYAIYCSVPNIVFTNINYNDYYVQTSGFVGYLSSARANIAAWQTATALDGNSVATNPIFVQASTSPIDLHLQLISPLNDQCTPIAGITTDIDGITRSASTPDIGADEFTPPACSANLGGTVSSDFLTICTSGSVSLTSTGFSYGLGITYQWQKSTDNVTFTDIAGETNPTSSNPPVITQTTWYRLKVVCAAGAPGYSNSLMITVYNPNIISTTPGTRCGPGTVNLSATGTAGTVMQWYTSATGGIPVYTGSPFTTPSISSTTNYYVESTFLGSYGSCGPVSPTAQGGTISTQLTSWDVIFNVIQPTKLLSVDVYPMVSGENSTIDVYNSSGTIIASVSYTTNVSGGNTAQTVNLNVPLPIGNGYYLYATGGIPTSGLKRNITGASYPYSSTDIVITGNGFDQTFYMCYYNWRFTNGCSSVPRTTVTATVGGTATVTATATPATICSGSSSSLNASSSNTSFTYTWTPGALAGATVSVSPTATTTYTVDATDGTCTASATVTVTVNPAATPIVVSPATVTKCPDNNTQLLSASGGDIVDVNIINENFNGATTPTGWVTSTAGSTGAAASKAWTLRPDGHVVGGSTFHSNDNSQFYLTSSYGLAGVTKTTLMTPAFSLVGYNSANLYFYHHFSQFNAIDSAVVEYATSTSGPWTRLRNFASRGATNNFRKDTINLTAYAGVATNYIRFRFFTNPDGFYWALDNVTIAGGNTGSPLTWAPLTGLYTNAGGSAPYLGGATPTVYANPTTTTTYTITATPPNGCSSNKTFDVTIRAVGGSISGPASVCPTGNANMSITLLGTGPWNITYTDGSTPVTVNNIATSPYTFTTNPAVTTTYTLTAVSDAYCTAPAGNLGSPFTVTVNPSLFSTWVGLTSDWNDLNNWCGGIPTVTKDVVIPVTSNSPVISIATAVSKDISIAAGATLTINSGAKLSAKGNFVNDGTIINNGTITLNGTTVQTFPGGTGTVTAMNDLEVNNSAGATFNKNFTISGALLPTAGNININNVVITLKSDATATARVGALGGTAGISYTGTGKFSIERYISSQIKPAWRFLAAPLRSDATQTINQAWQEGEIAPTYTPTGYGMQIVGPSSAGPGFDVNNQITSLKKYNPATNTWVTVPGTMGAIAATDGYMAFIRGDRGANVFGSQSPTTLRMAGPIKTGAVGPISTATANQFISVGNPYPSAIDFSLTSRTGLLDAYYVWDPQLGTYGGYQYFVAPAYNAFPGTGSYGTGNNKIESGQAFFVYSDASAGPHQISFGENCKVAGSNLVQRSGSSGKLLAVRMYSLTGSGNSNLIDGNLVEFDPSYSNTIDNLDIPKISNFGENIGIQKGNSILAFERHASIVHTDTIFYQLGQLRQQSYQLEFTAQDLAEPGLTAYLEDNYLHTTTTINLNQVSVIDFVVNADAASKAPDRFRLVFNQLGPVPVTFTSISAHREDKFVRVDWKVENELNIHHYEIERLTDGTNFIKKGEQVASGGTGTLQYSWLDVEPVAGNNFYRIKSVGNGNDIKYSEVVKVSMEGGPAMITVFPNPVKDQFINLSFINQPMGNYDVKLYGTTGQLIYKQQINYQGGSQRIKIPLNAGYAKGIYSLEVLPEGGKRRVFKVVVE